MLAQALLLFAHYRRDSRLGKAWIRTQRSCAASCCGCCLGSARNGKSLEEEDDLPVPKIATSASAAKPKTPATPTHAERRAIEAGEGRAQVQRHMRSVSNASLRQSLGLALRPPPAQQGRTRKPLARAPTLESLSEMTEPPASARCSSVKSARKASAVEVPGDKRTSGGSHYENATEMPLSAGLRQASLDEKQTEAVV